MMTIEEHKQQLQKEIKELASELADCQTFTGLLSYEIKFKQIQENFHVLKFLERKSLGKRDLENWFADHKVATLENIQAVEQGMVSEEMNGTKPSPIKKEPLPLFSEMMKEKIETVATQIDAKRDSGDKHSENSPKPLRLDLNDHMAFLTKLFKRDADAMDIFFEELKELKTVADSEQLLAEYAEEYGWSSDDEFFDRLKDLNAKRFEA